MLSLNLKGVSFLSMLAELGRELNQVTEIERRALFGHHKTKNTLLVILSRSDCIKDCDVEHQRHVDKKFLTAIQRLREKKLMNKENIQECDMVRWLLICNKAFVEMRVCYFVNWDPDCLAKNK